MDIKTIEIVTFQIFSTNNDITSSTKIDNERIKSTTSQKFTMYELSTTILLNMIPLTNNTLTSNHNLQSTSRMLESTEQIISRKTTHLIDISN